MKINDIVCIHPAYTLRFKGRAGIIVNIDPRHPLPYEVLFDGNELPYRFYHNEILPINEYNRLINQPTICERCGKDTTGSLEVMCEECLLYAKEEIIKWLK